MSHDQSPSNLPTANSNSIVQENNVVSFQKGRTTQAYKQRKLNRLKKSFEDFLPLNTQPINRSHHRSASKKKGR